MAPDDVHVLVPDAYEHVLLHGGRDLTDETKLRILGGDPVQSSVTARVLTRGRVRVRKGGEMTETEVKVR